MDNNLQPTEAHSARLLCPDIRVHGMVSSTAEVHSAGGADIAFYRFPFLFYSYDALLLI